MESKSIKELIAYCKEKQIRGYSGKKKAELLALLSAGTAPLTDLPTAQTAQTALPPTNVIVHQKNQKIQKAQKNKSPLRYPGGKTRAISILEKYVQTHFATKTELLSPFFGGGSFELAMKSKCKIYANDLFVPLYNFWKVQQSQPVALDKAVRLKIPISHPKFQDMRASIIDNPNPIDQAASYFCINRSSFSGATLCGGFSVQAAQNRLTESSIRTLANCDTKNIEFSNLDCIEFLEKHPQTDTTFVYADPPYYITSNIYGKNGDMHKSFNHATFATAIQKRSDWMISYNDCEYIRYLYKNCRIIEESWSYGMNKDKKSSEIIILPPEDPVEV